MPKPNIDLMFQSAAVEHKERTIGVLLSGAGNDGAIGIKAIRDKGGLTIVQSEASAEYKSMPKAAIETGAVDYCIPPEVIGATIARLVAGDQSGSVKQ